MIPLKKKRAKKRKYRIGTKSIFTKPKYHIETMISVTKRVFGDKNQSRNDQLRNKENKLRKTCAMTYTAT
ncbi:MAG: hypothetical protein LBC39_02290 [Methanobrevibacter sp.]|jgi:hypothetical protein|nr:hypothetical protein [Candidatus Methanovirga aequatorialis]